MENLAAILFGRAIVLGHVEAVALSALLKASPNYVTVDHLITLIYDDQEPEWAENSLKVTLSRLRKKVHPVATIEAGWHRYRLVAR